MNGPRASLWRRAPCRAQVRYLMKSEYGVLGALGFAGAALAVAARDEWIGWSAAMRRKRLHGVLNLSRFLIRPGIRCDGLASKVLGWGRSGQRSARLPTCLT